MPGPDKSEESEDLTASQRDLIERARAKAFLLYEGKVVPHRSCGIALAETFNLPARPYQCLRRGGITGEGECGAPQERAQQGYFSCTCTKRPLLRSARARRSLTSTPLFPNAITCVVTRA